MNITPRDQMLKIAGVELGDNQKWSKLAADTKKKVIAQFDSVLEPRNGESKADMKKRIAAMSNKKIVRLFRLAERLKGEFGGKKSALIDAVYQGSKDPKPGYREYLERQSLPALFAMLKPNYNK